MAVTTTAFQVTASATSMLAAVASGSLNRKSILIYNKGPNDISIGPDNTVTMANGFLIPAGAAATIDKAPTDALFAICSVLQVSPADTRILVES